MGMRLWTIAGLSFILIAMKLADVQAQMGFNDGSPWRGAPWSAAMPPAAADEAPLPKAAVAAEKPLGPRAGKGLYVAVVQMRSSRSLSENIHKTQHYLEQCAREHIRWCEGAVAQM